ncbi:MAG: AAA family ATPase [Chloroflexi bacterium]|nr:AAA family ATPase [Chloroflexota bacterium]
MTEAKVALRASTTAFVGREQELAELSRGLEEAEAGNGRLFLISGEPGIGKSRLADELGVAARHRGARVLWGRCWEGAGAPAYWPWVQVFRSYLRTTTPAQAQEDVGSGASDIAQMLPEIHETFPDLVPPPSSDPDAARFALFESAAALLGRASRRSPLVVIVEDLQSADTPSLLLLRFVVGQLSESRILIVATYRDEEALPGSPLATTLTDLIRAPGTRLVALSGLSDAMVARFIASAAGVVPQPSLVTALRQETNGNPLFLGETVRLLAAEGRLDEVADPASLRIAVPAHVRDVIVRRVRHLSKPCARALTVGTVLGPELGLEVLRRLVDLEAEVLLDRLGEAVRAGLLAPVQGTLGRYRFTHDLVRQSLYEELTPVERVRLHRRAGETLEDLYGHAADAPLEQLAYHFHEASAAGEATSARKAADYARRAGDQAAAALAYEEAVRLYRLALEAVELHSPAEKGTRGDLLLAMGDGQTRAGDLDGASVTLLEVATDARRTGSPRQLAEAALRYGGRFIWARAGADAHIVPMLQDALMLLGGADAELRVRLLGRLSCALRSSKDRELNDTLSQQSVDAARQLGDPETLAYALEARGAATWWPENPEERLALARELVDLGRKTRDAERAVAGHMMSHFALTELCRMAEAKEEVGALRPYVESLRQPAQRWLIVALSASAALMDGSFESAERLIPEGQAVTRATLSGDEVSGARFQLFLLRREQGRLSEIEDHVQASVAEFPWYRFHRMAHVLLLHELGRTHEARRMFDELSREDFGLFHRDNYWTLGIALASEACVNLDDKPAAEILYRELLPFAGHHAIGHPEGSVGVVDRYLGLLASLLDRIEDAEMHFRDAIRINDEMGARPWAAHARHDYARMLSDRGSSGDADAAREVAMQAMQTAQNLGMPVLERSLDRILGDATQIETPASRTARGTFRREGEYWSVTFEDERCRLRDSKGLHYVSRLLAAPGSEILALDLARVPGPASGDGSAGGRVARDGSTMRLVAADTGHELIDAEARDAYRERLRELQQEVDEAESWNDPERAARTREERDALVAELARAVGLGGRIRRSGSDTERARVSVTRAIRSALSRIGEHCPALARHLEATVRTGTFCSYTPDPSAAATWES